MDYLKKIGRRFRVEDCG